MSEPFAERLSRFTPDRSGLDRDALLFAAGRASVRPGRRWKAMASALAASQLLTLVFLWPHTPHQGADAPRSPFAPALPVAVEPPSPAPADSRSWAMSGRLLNELDDLPPPAASDSLVPDDPPLRASSPLAAFLN
ncbi:MAG TPA: hypothetical protein DDY78_05090 [Planctomycetales bacterium]|jgi:hypothetical protein|nr:hypothetical protein [Planctomycetales bacterium]